MNDLDVERSEIENRWTRIWVSYLRDWGKNNLQAQARNVLAAVDRFGTFGNPEICKMCNEGSPSNNNFSDTGNPESSLLRAGGSKIKDSSYQLEWKLTQFNDNQKDFLAAITKKDFHLTFILLSNNFETIAIFLANYNWIPTFDLDAI